MPEAKMSDPQACGIVLVVEDEPLIAMDVQMMLEQQGHEVLGPAGSIEHALRLLMRTQPDVAVLDLNIHGQLVTPVAERLHEMSVPFIIASADISVASGLSVLEGIENVDKPINESRLLSAVRRAAGWA